MSEKIAGRGAAHRVNDLIVALPHLDLVLDGLGTLGFGLARRPEENEALGLALLELTGPGAAGGTAADADSPLDRLLADLRAHFRAQHDGWVPVLGKNRTVETVGGAHVISGGGSQPPVAVAAGVEAEAVVGGWDSRSLAHDALVLPEPEPGAGRGGPRILHDGPPRPDGDRGRGATVAVCDTRLWAHRSLTGSYLAAPRAMLPLEPGPAGLPFTAGHATFVTGTILRNAPGTAIIVEPILDDHAKGTSWQLATTLVELAGRGVDVINVSAGFFTGDNEPALAMTTALRLIGPHTVVVAAAGNHGADGVTPRRPLWPAAHDEVVAVGALTAKGTRAAFSPPVPWLRLLAPGVNVVSDYLDDAVAVTGPGRTGRYPGAAAWSGTSFAAAWVSGLLAGRIRRGRVGARDALGQLIEDAGAGTTAARLPDQCG